MNLKKQLTINDLDEPLKSLAEQYGCQVVQSLIESIGGTTLSIPAGRFSPQHRIFSAISGEAAELLRQLCHQWGIVYLRIPSAETMRHRILKRIAIGLLNQGLSISEVARQTGFDRTRIIYYRNEVFKPLS